MLDLDPGLNVFKMTDRLTQHDVFLAVRYHDYWFYIDLTDHESKRAFGLLIYIFELQAPATSAAAPVLALPTGP